MAIGGTTAELDRNGAAALVLVAFARATLVDGTNNLPRAQPQALAMDLAALVITGAAENAAILPNAAETDFAAAVVRPFRLMRPEAAAVLITPSEARADADNLDCAAARFAKESLAMPMAAALEIDTEADRAEIFDELTCAAVDVAAACPLADAVAAPRITALPKAAPMERAICVTAVIAVPGDIRPKAAAMLRAEAPALPVRVALPSADDTLIAAARATLTNPALAIPAEALRALTLAAPARFTLPCPAADDFNCTDVASKTPARPLEATPIVLAATCADNFAAARAIDAAAPLAEAVTVVGPPPLAGSSSMRP